MARHPSPQLKARRRTPGASTDVMRIEHENLYAEVQENLRLIRLLETEIQRLKARMNEIEQRVSQARSSKG
jgi:hypothetical protein